MLKMLYDFSVRLFYSLLCTAWIFDYPIRLKIIPCSNIINPSWHFYIYIISTLHFLYIGQNTWDNPSHHAMHTYTI